MSVIKEIRLKIWPHGSSLSRSVKVIGADTDRFATYDFLLKFLSNHEIISYRFRNKWHFSRKSRIFPTRPRVFCAPLKAFPLELGTVVQDQKLSDGATGRERRITQVRSVFLGVSHAPTARGQGSSAAQFLGSLLFMHATFDSWQNHQLWRGSTWGNGVYLGVSHSSHLKRGGVPALHPSFGAFPVFMPASTQNDQIQHGNAYGEGRVFTSSAKPLFLHKGRKVRGHGRGAA